MTADLFSVAPIPCLPQHAVAPEARCTPQAWPDSAQREPLSVFISNSRDDVEFADPLHATLIIGGYNATIDRPGIHVGEDWERRLGDMIRSADTIVFLLSPSSARSPACAWEQKLTGLWAALVLTALAGWFDAELQRGRAQRVLD